VFSADTLPQGRHELRGPTTCGRYSITPSWMPSCGGPPRVTSGVTSASPKLSEPTAGVDIYEVTQEIEPCPRLSAFGEPHPSPHLRRGLVTAPRP
jgi:hypothetical protein